MLHGGAVDKTADFIECIPYRILKILFLNRHSLVEYDLKNVLIQPCFLLLTLINADTGRPRNKQITFSDFIAFVYVSRKKIRLVIIAGQVLNTNNRASAC